MLIREKSSVIYSMFILDQSFIRPWIVIGILIYLSTMAITAVQPSGTFIIICYSFI